MNRKLLLYALLCLSLSACSGQKTEEEKAGDGSCPAGQECNTKKNESDGQQKPVDKKEAEKPADKTPQVICGDNQCEADEDVACPQDCPNGNQENGGGTTEPAPVQPPAQPPVTQQPAPVTWLVGGGSASTNGTTMREVIRAPESNPLLNDIPFQSLHQTPRPTMNIIRPPSQNNSRLKGSLFPLIGSSCAHPSEAGEGKTTVSLVVTLFQGKNFSRGRAMYVQDASHVAMDNSATSIIIRKGPNYRPGDFVRLFITRDYEWPYLAYAAELGPGRWSDLTQYSNGDYFDDSISSIKFHRPNYQAGECSTWDANDGLPKWHAPIRYIIRLYEDLNHVGERLDFITSTPSLDLYHFGNEADGVDVKKGPDYEEGDLFGLYSEDNYTGNGWGGTYLTPDEFDIDEIDSIKIVHPH
ncbi:MAG: hypothetical protein Q7S98_05315 [Deltaproteobacteria bacterium]|nr:hypothetical protein [Deltaproteobacteria bacterium]